MTTPLPEQFIEMLKASGNPRLCGLPDVLRSTTPETSIRWNTLKGMMPEQGAETVPWWKPGQYLAERPQFTFDPAMHQGLYYVQEASSMAIGHSVAKIAREIFLNEPVRYLDACAAPGGKTTCAIEALPPGSIVVANEMNPQRAQVLAENVAKHGSPSVIVTRSDAATLGRKLPATFDIVSVDAPCSGEGMMRKEPVAVAQWTERLVADCAKTQRDILAGAWEALKPGGVLIYSTCTFNTVENESQAQWLIDTFDAEPIDLAPLPTWNIEGPIIGSIPCMRFIPGATKGEGLFMCALRKPFGTTHPSAKNKKQRHDSGNHPKNEKKLIDACRDFIIDSNNYDWFLDRDASIHAFPSAHSALLSKVRDAATVLSFGVETATPKGNGIIASHRLSMSVALNRESFPNVEIDTATALSYLRRETIHLPDSTPRGTVLLTHCDHPLAFANNLGTRANNLYPSNWRIVSQTPD